jgi:hypothetical protein
MNLRNQSGGAARKLDPIVENRIASLQATRAHRLEALDAVMAQVDRSGWSPLLRKWRDDLSNQVDAIDRLIRAARRGGR